jgi:GT2 family glycosyltransferase
MRLSVIVCTRNRAAALIECLESVARSLDHAAPIDAEIVVIDNGSQDETAARVRSWAGISAYPVRMLFEPGKGLSVARNCALRAAQGALLVWTDDDCRVSRGYIADLLRHDAADRELVLRGGRVELGDPADLPICIKTTDAMQRWHRQKYPKEKWRLSGAFIGANMAMRRAVIDEVGFFDERFGAGTSLHGGEEIDYIYRAYLAGIIIEYVPDMVVFHHHGRKTVAVGTELMQGYVIGGGGLYAKYIFRHIDFCRPLYWCIKNAFLETIHGVKYPKDKVGFSSAMCLRYIAIGVMRYFFASTRQRVRGLTELHNPEVAQFGESQPTPTPPAA